MKRGHPHHADPATRHERRSAAQQAAVATEDTTLDVPFGLKRKAWDPAQKLPPVAPDSIAEVFGSGRQASPPGFPEAPGIPQPPWAPLVLKSKSQEIWLPKPPLLACQHEAFWGMADLTLVGCPSPGLTPVDSSHFCDCFVGSHVLAANRTQLNRFRAFAVLLIGGESGGATGVGIAVRRPALATTSAAVPVQDLTTLFGNNIATSGRENQSVATTMKSKKRAYGRQGSPHGAYSKFCRTEVKVHVLSWLELDDGGRDADPIGVPEVEVGGALQ